jgi:hypothetical protein
LFVADRQADSRAARRPLLHHSRDDARTGADAAREQPDDLHESHVVPHRKC